MQTMATRCDDTEGDGAVFTTPKFSGSAATLSSHGIPWLGCDRVAGPQTTARDTQAIARGLERQRYTVPTCNPTTTLSRQIQNDAVLHDCVNEGVVNHDEVIHSRDISGSDVLETTLGT